MQTKEKKNNKSNKKDNKGDKENNKSNKKDNNIEKNEIKEQITTSVSPFYDENDEVVIMNGDYMEELDKNNL